MVLDVLFAEPERASASEAEGDRVLAEAIGRGKLVLGMAFAEHGAKPIVKAGFAFAGDDPRPFLPSFTGALLPLAALREPATGLGAMNFVPDRDLVVRELPTVFNVVGQLVPSLSAEALRVAQGASTFVIRTTNASGDSDFGERSGVTGIKIGAIETLTGRTGQSGSATPARAPSAASRLGAFLPASSIRSRSTAPSCSSARRRARSRICVRRRSRPRCRASTSTPR